MVSARVVTHTAYEVDGVLLPAPLAGHPALEFCNTFAGWDEPEDGRDYLRGYRELVIWARERGLIDPGAAGDLAGASDRSAVEVVERARRLRAALHRTLTSTGDPVDWTTIAAEAQRAAAAAQLERRGHPSWVWALPRSVELPLQATAVAAARFLVQPVRIGCCPGRHCGWLFPNPRGTRRWCSMAVCGNRAKVARHTQRGSRRGRTRRGA